MKIIQLVTSRKSRGAEISAQRLSEKLIQLGHQVWFLGLYEHPENLCVEGGVNLDLTEKKSSLNVKLIFSIKKLIKEIKPDIVQANGSDTFKYASLAMTGSNKPKLIYRNISVFSYWINERPLIKWIYGLLAKRIDHFVSVGHYASADLQQTLQLSTKKCSIIKRGFDTAMFDKENSRHQLIGKWGLSNDDFIIVQVGSLSLEKNVTFSLDVLAELKKEISQVKLLLVGEGPQEAVLRSKSEALAISRQVVFCGYQKEVREILAGADLLLLTSLVEGVPGVVVEAAIQDTPTVAIKIPGTEELISDGSSGVLIDSYDTNQFADKILSVQRDDLLRLNLANQARRQAIQAHDEAVNTKQFEELYKRLVN
ncbi:glycosyltransferase family 4 protein [Belliella sp. R4-6]|uniref:Glycosyltransferase family 4 protein n=1 Tax=Belliella alkalica TaxID=1730871 RepID=A0ABS9V8E7_9BACT|nr:glycosyltransferase family 4 protein [Belliella alkalica]MCH7412395.1 glycosyltransferase family 4 protein [Belliella alkalica]